MRPVPQNIDGPLAAFLADLRSAVFQIQNPSQPQQPFATTSAKLPPAASWKNCVANVTDKNCLAISTEVAGTWEWLRADGTAL